MTARMAWRLKYTEILNHVAFAQCALRFNARAGPKTLLESSNRMAWVWVFIRYCTSARRFLGCNTTPERQVKVVAEKSARTLMIGVGMSQHMGRQITVGERLLQRGR